VITSNELYTVLYFRYFTEFIFSQHLLSNFSKEFYHWLAISDNAVQQVNKRNHAFTLITIQSYPIC